MVDRSRPHLAHARTFILVLPLAVCACGVPSTPPETSEELAQAFRLRMRDEPFHATSRVPGLEQIGYEAELVTRQTRFAGVEQGIALDPALRDAVQSYWGGNVFWPDYGELNSAPYRTDLGSLRRPLATYHAELATRYLGLAEVLDERIAAHPGDTAARGLLAVSLLLHANAVWAESGREYPRLALLRDALGLTTPLEAPSCVLYSDDPGASTGRADCYVTVEERHDVLVATGERVLALFDDIAAVTPDSTWVEVGRLLVEPEADPTPAMTLPRSTSRASVPVGESLVISEEAIWLNGEQVADIAALHRGLQEQVEDIAHLEARHPGRAPERRLIVRADVDLPFGLVRGVLLTAHDVGFDQVALVFLRVDRERGVIHTIHLGATDVKTFVADAGWVEPPETAPVIRLSNRGVDVPGSEMAGAENSGATVVLPPASGWGAERDKQLAEQVHALRAARPDADSVAMIVDEDVPFHQVVATLDTLQRRCVEGGECEPLFPRVRMSVAKPGELAFRSGASPPPSAEGVDAAP
jgi:biopolymer transport protein ExbD